MTENEVFENDIVDISCDFKSSKLDITQHEIEALKTQYNLADAHTHQKQRDEQISIVNSLSELWYSAETDTQYKSEQEFIDAFYSLHGQQSALKRRDNIYLVYAASVGMHITATYLMKHNMRVGLIEPCFDNLHDLLKHMQIPMSALPESIFYNEHTIYDNLVKNAIVLDAIVLVDPNNPTGFSLFTNGSESFLEVVRFCSDYNKVLILDFSFASFIISSGGVRFDIYEILENSGISYISMEDTGKTWPMQDAKCSTILPSKDLNDEIYKIVTSVLLNVSPFILKLVTRYVQASAQDGFKTVRELLDKNRNIVINKLDCGLLQYCKPQINTSVVWFKIKDKRITADMLHDILFQKNVYVLSGKFFYWSNPDLGQRYIRIALARDTDVFTKSINVIKEVINDIKYKS